MEDALGEVDVTLVGVVTDRFEDALGYHSHAVLSVASALCRGLSARTRAGYGLFRCKLIYIPRGVGLGGGYFRSYWARP